MIDNIDGANLRRLLDATARKEEIKTAKWMCERIIKQINEFEEDMPGHLMAGGREVSFHNTAFSIDNVRYWNPDMIIFDGTNPDGSKIRLLQHTSQLNLLLQAVPRSDKKGQRRKIGFVQDTQEEE